MTEGQKEIILERLCAANAAQQNYVAEAVRLYPEAPVYDLLCPVMEDPEALSQALLTGHLLRDKADYTMALAWFYAKVRPTNALRTLILAKANVIKRGDPVASYWKYLEALGV